MRDKVFRRLRACRPGAMTPATRRLRRWCWRQIRKAHPGMPPMSPTRRA